MKSLWKQKKKLARCSLPAGSSFSPSQKTYLGQVPALEQCDSSRVSLEAELKEGCGDALQASIYYQCLLGFLPWRPFTHRPRSPLAPTGPSVTAGSDTGLISCNGPVVPNQQSCVTAAAGWIKVWFTHTELRIAALTPQTWRCESIHTGNRRRSLNCASAAASWLTSDGSEHK